MQRYAKNLKGDIYGGLTAAIVALPLALAFGVASGMGPMAGMYGAIFVGFFAALFGGTPSQISGPTGPMTIVMAGVVISHADNFSIIFTIVVLAGIFQILFGVMRIGRYISLVPFPVVSGFMSGIGCTIIILQLPQLLGFVTPSGGAVNILSALPAFFANLNPHTLTVGLIAFFIIMLTPTHINKIIPSQLIALVIGTLAVMYVLIDADTLGDIPTGLPSFHMPVLSAVLIENVIVSALALAILGSIDSLLTSLAADNMTHTQHNPDRELIGQGIGNAFAGVFGGIPGAGATIRTVTNIRAGGRTNLSGMIHSLVLLSMVVGVAPLVSLIPNAVLAGLLIKIGLDIIDWGYIKRMHRAPRSGVLFMLTVLFLTVFVNLIVAVTTGVILASLLLVKRMADLQLDSIHEINSSNADSSLSKEENEILQRNDGRIVVITMSGPMSFGAARGMVRRLEKAENYDVLIVDMSAVTMIDSTIALALEDIIDSVQSAHKHVLLVGITKKVMNILDKLGALKELASGHSHTSRIKALHHAAHMAGSTHPDDAPPKN